MFLFVFSSLVIQLSELNDRREALFKNIRLLEGKEGFMAIGECCFVDGGKALLKSECFVAASQEVTSTSS